MTGQMNSLVDEMKQLDKLFKNIDAWRCLDDAGFHTIRAGLALNQMNGSFSFDEFMIQLDLHCIAFIHSTVFTSMCIDAAKSIIHRSKFLTSATYVGYLAGIEKFKLLMHEILFHST